MTLPEIEDWALDYLSVPEEALTECEARQLRAKRALEADRSSDEREQV
jgi:hypothetical protein